MMDIGMIGMAVMGRNLARNMAEHGFDVACYNYTRDLTDKVLAEDPHPRMQGFFDVESFVRALKRPRKIMMLIMAGAPVDTMLDALCPLLEEGDIILDGGNSFFADTQRRFARAKALGIYYFGVGISGGEKGARHGPALMPGGDARTYEEVRPILEAIAAKVEGEPCCAYIGEDGAGHFVKMVHNGIEYADMQLIAESYLLLKEVAGLSNEELAETFAVWNQGELKSFLIEITARIFREADDLSEGNLIDMIRDSAGQKGTGQWTSMEAMKEGVNVSLIAAACNARIASNQWTIRQALGKAPEKISTDEIGMEIVEAVRQSLYLGKIVAYAQGFELYRAAAKTYGWSLDYGRIASIFRGGCIIQAIFLQEIKTAYERNPALENLVLDAFFGERICMYLSSLRQVAVAAVSRGTPIPALLAALGYIDTFRAPHLGANLIQAQRDCFGAHTYERIDRGGMFHHPW